MDRSELAQLFRLFADALEQPLPQVALISEAAPLAPQQPEKLKAPEGSNFTTTPTWRHFITQLEQQLRERFGDRPILLRTLRDFLQEHVDLLPGDRDRHNSGRNGSPRWYQQLQKAVDCEAHCWLMGKPVIVSIKENRGYYRLA